jgi:hypothetical protein
MKRFLFLCMTILALGISYPVFSADEDQNTDQATDQATDDSSQMSTEKIIAACEEQFPADSYPDTEERNKLIDQCVDESTPPSRD